MPPNPEKCNTILRRFELAPNELVAKVSNCCGWCAKRVEQFIRGQVTCAPVAAVGAAVRRELRNPKPEAAAC